VFWRRKSRLSAEGVESVLITQQRKIDALGQRVRALEPPPEEPWEKTAAEIVDLIALRHGSGGANHPKVKALYRLGDEAAALLKEQA